MIDVARLRGLEVAEVLSVDDDPRLRPRGSIGWPAISDGAGVGWFWDGSTFWPPGSDLALERERKMMSLSKRQFILGLGPGIKDASPVGKNWISEAEGEAWLQGSGLPAIAVAYIAALPADQRPAATYTLYGMSVVYRTDALLVALALDPAAVLLGVTVAEIDDLFREFADV